MAARKKSTQPVHQVDWEKVAPHDRGTLHGRMAYVLRGVNKMHAFFERFCEDNPDLIVDFNFDRFHIIVYDLAELVGKMLDVAEHAETGAIVVAGHVKAVRGQKVAPSPWEAQQAAKPAPQTRKPPRKKAR